jgi:hypothetical protein
MTIPALLRRVSVTAPRYVTIDGQVVLDEVPTRGGPLVAPAGFPLQPHRFHGGAEPDVLMPEGGRWWDDEDVWQADTDEMARWFPRFFPVTEDGDNLYLGTIDTGRGTFTVALFLRPDRSLPRVVVLQPKNLGRPAGKAFIKPPHLYISGALCIANQDDWTSDYGTIVAVAWTAHWLACYTEWRMNGGIWPSEGYVPRVA